MASNLKNIKEDYFLSIRYYETSRNIESLYSAVFQIETAMVDGGDKLFCSIYRRNILIDGKKPRKLGDRVMTILGDAIFPLMLEISFENEILSVVNLQEVQERWNRISKDLLSKHPTVIMKQYITKGIHLLSDQKLFIESLLNDAFFNLYFRNIHRVDDDVSYASNWNNFPKQGLQRLIYCKQEQIDRNTTKVKGKSLKITPDTYAELNAVYKSDDTGKILSIQGDLKSLYQSREYIKTILIEIK